jgi:muramoyltetrapeptide carboxypeptidase
MRKPRALRSGDRVAIVAPASPFDRAELDAGLEEVRRLGFEPVFDERLFARRGYLAGDAGLRARAFSDAIRDPAIAGIFCARGGYGSVQILSRLDAGEIAAGAKPIVAYSDVTSLLVFVTQAAGLVAFHGPMLAGRLSRGEAGYDRASFLGALTRAEPLGEVGAGTVEPICGGEARGPLCGGTLTQLTASLSTPFAFDPPSGCVLFIDEVNERPYRLDRMLTQLRLAGVLDRASAIVFNELPGCDEPDGRVRARDAVADVLRGLGKPVLMGLPAGHATGPVLTLPLGVAVRVVAGPRPAVIVEEAAVDG